MTSKQKLTLGGLVIVNVIVIAIVVFMLQGNRNNNDNSSDVDTALATEEAVVTPDVDETPELDSNATEVVEDTAATDLTVASSSNNLPPQFDISVSYANLYGSDSDMEAPESLGAPPAGQRWVMVTGTLFNNSASDTISIDTDDLILVTEDGEEFLPEAPNGEINPYLVETNILATESIYGFVVYAIPVDATPASLRWCPAGICDAPLIIEIPVLE